MLLAYLTLLENLGDNWGNMKALWEGLLETLETEVVMPEDALLLGLVFAVWDYSQEEEVMICRKYEMMKA